MHVGVLQKKQTSEQEIWPGVMRDLYHDKEVRSPRIHNDPMLCASDNRASKLHEAKAEKTEQETDKPNPQLEISNCLLSVTVPLMRKEKDWIQMSRKQTTSSSPIYIQLDSQRKAVEYKNTEII